MGQHMSQAFSENREYPRRGFRALAVTVALSLAPALLPAPVSAQVMSYAPTSSGAFPSDDAMSNPDMDDSQTAVLPQRLRRAVVAFNTQEAPGTVIIDTGNTALYYVLGQNRAIRYGVGVGREGFTWSGTQTVTRKAEWPDWHPPAEMIARQPYLPRFMAGGPGNPLGARAMYLGSSAYRIHGTNDPSTIGKFVSSGCIRLTNEDVEDLFSRVSVGTKVVVLPKNGAGRLQAAVSQPRTVTHIQIKPTPVNFRADRQAVNISASSLY
jgi:lipoprotein-anchoring transpeptidase ErfK/SrfK